MKARAWLPLCLGVLLQMPALARGAEGEPHERSRAAFRAGNEAFRAGELERARRLYQEALLAERRFDVVCNLGRTEAELGDDRLALLHLDECLRDYPPDPKIAGARSKFLELREKVRVRCDERSCDAPRSASEPSGAPSEASGGDTKSWGVPASGELGEQPGPFIASSRSSARLPVVLSLAAAGLVVVGVGVGLEVHAGSLADRARELRGDIQGRGGYCAGAVIDGACAEFRDAYVGSEEASTWALGGFVLGGGLLVSSALSYVFWPAEPSAEEGSARGARGGLGRVEPWVIFVPGAMGQLGISGSF